MNKIDYSCPHINSVVNFIDKLPHSNPKIEAINHLNNVRTINEQLREQNKLFNHKLDRQKKKYRELQVLSTVFSILIFLVAISTAIYNKPETTYEYIYMPCNKKSSKSLHSEDKTLLNHFKKKST